MGFSFGKFRVGKARTRFEEEAMVHMDAIYGSALYLTRNERDAEDLTQETFLKAFRHFDKYEQGTNCRAWLFRIMTNTFLNKTRRPVREMSFLEEVDTHDRDTGASEHSAHLLDPEAGFLSRMFGDQVKQALESLPPDFRTAVVLADLQDFSYKEIADIMDCPVGTVMSRIFRGRRLLQKQLFDYAQQQGVITGSFVAELPETTRDGAISLSEYRQKKTATQGG